MSYSKFCTICGVAFEAKFPHQQRCSRACTTVAGLRRQRVKDQSLTIEEWETRRRLCRWCGQEFRLTSRDANARQYCSDDCQKAGYAERKKAFHARNPGKQSEYNRRRGRDTLIIRLRRRFPDLPESCEACGESRVLDLAHKPQHARNGAHRTLRVYQRYMFWILCPTCHALVDRGVVAPTAMGLVE
jgi:predicted nucleic acid-binding Zn ribbon protein